MKMRIKIKLLQYEYGDNALHQFPCTTGNPAVFVMDGSWYTAPAADSSGNQYTVIWDAPENPEAMDWTTPRCVLCDGKDVTQNVVLDL